MTPSTPGSHEHQDAPRADEAGTGSGSPSAQPDANGARDLALASEQLRDRSRGRAVEIADRVLLRALQARRRSYPVRGRGAHGFVFVSDKVVIATLRASIDERLDEAAVANVVLDITRDHELTGVAVELYARFGAVLVEAADQARVVAANALRDLLGVEPDVVVQAGSVALSAHVHVRDVTHGDPHLVDPADEQSPAPPGIPPH